MQADLKSSSIWPDAADFLLNPTDFVSRTARKLCIPQHILAPAMEDVLSAAIKNGKSRFDVIQCLWEYAGIDQSELVSLRSENLMPSSIAPFVITELLSRYAKDADREFIPEVYRQLLGRDPERHEILADLAKIREQGVERLDYIKAMASHHDVSYLLSSDSAEEVDECMRIRSAETLVNNDGRREIIIVRKERTHGWLVHSSVWMQDFEIHDGKMRLHEGWVCVGPKKTLQPGRWILDLKISQDKECELVVDVVANAGLDRLLNVAARGSTYAALSFDISADHRFTEVRVRKPAERTQTSGVLIENISLVRIS